MARIGIVGGSGFIGRHTTDLLLKQDHDVTVIDLVSPHNDKVKYIHADITNHQQIQSAIYALDYVYILAACKYVGICYNNPAYGVDTNIRGLTNVLDACKNANVQRVIFSSSVWVYNGCDGDSVDETVQIPAHTDGTLYGYTKVVGEGLVKQFQQLYDLDYTILRYGVAYGPGASDETVISKFISNALAGRPLTILGAGDVSRNFLYVGDHAHANVLALQDIAKNQIFNIEGGEEITVRRVADTARKLCSKKVVVKYEPARLGEFRGKIVSNEKAHNLLGWKPSMSFDEGMRCQYMWESKKKCNV